MWPKKIIPQVQVLMPSIHHALILLETERDRERHQQASSQFCKPILSLTHSPSKPSPNSDNDSDSDTMHCFYLDAMNECGSEAILHELGIEINQQVFDLDDSHIPEYVLGNLCPTNNQAGDEYKEKKSCHRGITYQSHLKGFYVDVRDAADCWLRICLEPKQSLSLPCGLYHRLYADTNHVVSFLTHTYEGTAVETELRYPESKDALYSVPVPHRFRELTCELCRQFYQCGWVTGTGGSISIRYGNRIYMTPSGVQKERIQPDELFMLDISGQWLSRPAPKRDQQTPKISDCAPLFFHAYRLRNAGVCRNSVVCVRYVQV